MNRRSTDRRVARRSRSEVRTAYRDRTNANLVSAVTGSPPASTVARPVTGMLNGPATFPMGGTGSSDLSATRASSAVTPCEWLVDAYKPRVLETCDQSNDSRFPAIVLKWMRQGPIDRAFPLLYDIE